VAPLSLSLSSSLCLSNSHDLEHFVSVKFFKARWGDDFLVVLLREQQARLLESLAVEVVGIFEDLAHRIHIDVLGKDVFTFAFDRLNVVSVCELEKLVYHFAIYFYVVWVDVLQQFHQLIVGNSRVGEIDDAAFSFLEVVGEESLEVGGSGSQHDLMCVNLLLFDDECYVAEVLLA
jgi:hypothetical protein